MRIKVTDEFTEISIPAGTIQNTSRYRSIEIASTSAKDTGIIVEPLGKMQFDSGTTVFVRTTGTSLSAYGDVYIAIESFKHGEESGSGSGDSSGGVAIDECRLWKQFMPNTAYVKGDVFRTPNTPSWGYWEVTVAGTSNSIVPSKTTESETEASGTMKCALRRLGNSESSGGGTISTDEDVQDIIDDIFSDD